MVPEKDKELLKLSQDQLDIQIPEIKKKVLELKKIRKKILSLGLDLQGGVNITLQVSEEDLKNQLMEKYDYDQNKVDGVFKTELASANDRLLEVLKNRMDQFGVAEPIIRKTFEGRISVELPGLNNPQLIEEALSKVGRLEFKIVDEASMQKLKDLNVPMPSGVVKSREDVPAGFEVPEDSEWVASWKNDEYGTPILEGWLVLQKKAVMDGTMVKTARNDQDNFGRPKVDFQLTSEGADVFAEITAQNIGKRLAIVLDGKIKSAPSINGEIPGGTGEITGSFTQEETIFLANVLKAGALPVKLEIAQKRVIGPSLGRDSITDSIKALIIGSVVVVIFMIIYYRTSGFVAIMALSFHMLYIIALMAGVGTTLTLSSIAGIILTVGMAVDSNIIIYERIREELRRSGIYKRALENGFMHASSTIWDSNMTSLISAFVLYVLGTGTIKGFGLTMSFGIISNVFASLFLSRLILDWWLDVFKKDSISV